MNWMLLAGSLVAIIAMTLAARWLGLGAEPRIVDPDHARRLADEAHCGFQAVDVAIARDGTTALLRDGVDRLMLLRPHGNHFVSRLLDPSTSWRVERGQLILSFAETMFDEVTLDLGEEAAAWAGRLEILGKKSHA